MLGAASSPKLDAIELLTVLSNMICGAGNYYFLYYILCYGVGTITNMWIDLPGIGGWAD